MTPEQKQLLDDENKERSLRRTQKELQDLIDCNDFEWFGTFTFDAKKIDRYDEKLVKTTFTKWANNQKRHSPNMNYIFVPERHKDGAIHFHALLGNYNGKMQQSGSKWQGEPIFNLTSYKYGFTNFTKIRDKAKTANYCRKYITKDMYSTKASQRRYWRSTNLKTPQKVYNHTFDDVLKYWLKNDNPTPDGSINPSDISTYTNTHVDVFSFPLKSKPKPPYNLAP